MKKITALLLTAFLATTLAMAQEDEMKPEKYKDPSIYSITYIKFHPGKMGRAQEIIKDYFMKASEEAKTDVPMMTMSMMSGKWQMMTIWKSDLADMEWKMSPDGVKWWDAMVELAGSEEEAVKIREEYVSLIADSTSEMARATEW